MRDEGNTRSGGGSHKVLERIPPHSAQLKVSIHATHIHVLILTFNRPEALNAMTPTLESDIKRCMDWFDDEPSLWVCIITGAGRAFCAGADLKAWNGDQQRGQKDEQERLAASGHGFASLSRRWTSSKPIIAAVNGIGAFGGGVEIVLNCDLVIACEEARFSLPEVKQGVVAAQGGIPRLTATAGRQLASEMLLLGRSVSAQEAHTRFGFVNEVVPKDQVLSRAVAWAEEIVLNSPDAVQSTKRGIVLAMQHADIEQATIAHAWSSESKRVYKGENIKEGLKAFAEKRKPAWTNPSKL